MLDALRRRVAYRSGVFPGKFFLDPLRFVKNQWRLRASGRQMGDLESARTFFGQRMWVVHGEQVSNEIAYYGYTEENLTECVIRLVGADQVVIDIGAHVGYYSSLLSVLVGSGGAVHAFEPTPSTHRITSRNLEGFPWATVHPEAVSREAGTMELKDYGMKWMAYNTLLAARKAELPAPTLHRVRCTTLDDIADRVAPKQVAFIKIDAESSELDILAGGKRCLAIHRPFVSIEVGDCPGCPGSKMIVDHLIEMGFLPWEFSAGRFHRHRRREIYEVGNLIFSPTEKDLNSLGDPSAPCIPCQGSAKSAH